MSDLNFLNRRMRTRMSGGVGGDRRGHYAPPPLSRFATGVGYRIRTDDLQGHNLAF